MIGLLNPHDPQWTCEGRLAPQVLRYPVELSGVFGICSRIVATHDNQIRYHHDIFKSKHGGHGLDNFFRILIAVIVVNHPGR